MTIAAFWNAEYAAALVNHLWQSTGVVGIAWLLALALRKNHARVRYWVWFAASVKFLLPFSLLIAAGELLRSLIPAPSPRPAVASVMQQVTQPFEQTQFFDAGNATVAAQHESWLPVLLLAAWACGALIVAIRFGRGWWRVYAAKRAALAFGTLHARRPVENGTHRVARAYQSGRAQRTTNVVPFHDSNLFKAFSGLSVDVPVLCAPGQIEPGVFGIFRPVLLLPEWIEERLSDEQMQAIVAHEMCHVRRRDNLTFVVHMVVEALFWFHPAVWWIGARLIDERECACDEAVVQAGGKAEVYAEGILNVCKFYIESPLACASGVTGAELKGRIARIMAKHMARNLGPSRWLLLGAVVSVALALPISVGLSYAVGEPLSTAQQPQQAKSLQFEVAAIKPGNPRLGVYSSTSGGRPGGRFQMVNVPLKRWVQMGLSVRGYALKAPSWLDTSRFDLDARLPVNIPLDHDPKAEMMKALLVERFGLKYHEEFQTVSGYELVPDKKVLAKPASLLERMKGHGSGYGNSSISGMNMPMSELAGMLGEALGKPVVDATHLSGGYDIKLMWRPDNDAAVAEEKRYGKQYGIDVDNLPSSVFAALQEQLGLRLQSAKVPSRIIVVDSINRQPTEN